MTDERVVVQACSHHRFWITNLTIHPELIGAIHSFERRKRRVHISMPSLFTVIQTRLENREQIYVGSHWTGEEDKPHYYLVQLVHVRVEASEGLDVPAAALNSPPKRPELFTDNERRRLDELLSDLSEIAVDAYAYWLRVLRWKSGVASIGEPQLIRHSLEITPALECMATHRRFWLFGSVIEIPRAEMVSCDQWVQTQEALDRQAEPPLWLEFWFDGEHRIRNGDLTGAVLSLAIAFEAAVRRLVTFHLSSQTERLIFLLMDLSNIMAIMNRLTSLSFWDDGWNKSFDSANLYNLVQTRNDIMHLAKVEGLDEPTLRKHSASVRKFVYHVSRYLGTV